MTVVRGFIITIMSSLAFAVFGGLAGVAIGLFMPNYYRMVFRIPPDVPTDLVQGGLGLGLTQGFVAGIIIGLVIVVTVAWYDSRVFQKPKFH